MSAKRPLSVCPGLALVAGICFATLAVGEDPKPAPPKPAPAAEPSPNLALIPADAIAFVHINVAALWDSEPIKAIRKEMGSALEEFLDGELRDLGVPIASVQEFTFVVLGPDPAAAMIVRTGQPYDRSKVVAAVVGRSRELEHKGRTIHVKKVPRQVEEEVDFTSETAVYAVDERCYVFGELGALQQLIDHPVRPGAKGPLTSALDVAAEKHHFVAAVSLPESLREALDKARFQAIGQDRVLGFGFQAFKRVTDSQLAVLTVDFGLKTQARLTLHYPSEARAKEGVWDAKNALEALREITAAAISSQEKQPEGPVLAEPFKQVLTALRSATVEQQGAKVEVNARVRFESEMLAQFAAGAHEATLRIRGGNNLAQIMIAWHMFHHDYNMLPPRAVFTKNGKPLLSWRVLILPYVGEQELFKQFKLDEPWDSEHNKKLLEKMPKVYASPGMATKEPFTTYYQGFVGGYTMLEGDPRKRYQGVRQSPLGPNIYVPRVKITLSQGSIPDGTSNIVAIVEAGEPVPWTKPADIPFDPKNPPRNLESPRKGGFSAVFMDRSVRFVKKGVAPKTLGCLIDRRDGEVLDLSDLE